MDTRLVSRVLASAGDALVSVFFPGDCRLCQQLLTTTKRIPICEECLDSFRPLSGAICEICGQPLETFAASMDSGKGPRQPHSGARRICGVCQLSTYSFDRARSYALYDAGLIRAIVMLKFERIRPLGDWFAERLAEVIRREGCLAGVDVVVPVPLHQQRKRNAAITRLT
jgi:predicted amidophosphoribosyltransferase